LVDNVHEFAVNM